jgi:hypothetical protein
VKREAFVGGTASPGRGGALLADEGGGRHLAAGHPVDCVVDEEDCDLFTAVGGVDDFGGADGSEVAVALIGDDDFVGAGSLDCGGRGGAAVRHLDVANVEVIIGEHGAADGTDEDGAVLQAQVGDGFGNQLVRNAVTAARAVVRLVLEFRLALVQVIKDGRLGVGYLVTIRGIAGSCDSAFESSAIVASLKPLSRVSERLRLQHVCHPAEQVGVNLFDRRHVAAGTSVEADRNPSVQGQADILHHLPVAKFDHQDLVDVGGSLRQGIAGEGPERDGAEQADAQAMRASFLDRRTQDARSDAVSHEQDVGVVGVVELPARLLLLRAPVLGFEMPLMIFEIVGLEENRADQILLCLRRSLHRPRFFGSDDLAIFEIERFHHLADETVGEDDDGIAVPVRELECEDGEVGHFLHRGGREQRGCGSCRGRRL